MNGHSQILVVGHDQMLLQTRRLILGTYFDVEAAGRLSEVGMLVARRDYDLIVLCDTLSESECRQVADLVHDRKPQPALLSLMGPGNHRSGTPVGKPLYCGGPLQLLKECADALHYDLRGKQRMYTA